MNQKQTNQPHRANKQMYKKAAPAAFTSALKRTKREFHIAVSEIILGGF